MRSIEKQVPHVPAISSSMLCDIVDCKLTPPADSATILTSYRGPTSTFKKKASTAFY